MKHCVSEVLHIIAAQAFTSCFEVNCTAWFQRRRLYHDKERIYEKKFSVNFKQEEDLWTFQRSFAKEVALQKYVK